MWASAKLSLSLSLSYGIQGDKLCSIPVTLVKSKKKVLPKEMSKAIQEYFHLSSGCLFPVENMKDDLIELEEKLVRILLVWHTGG